MTYTTRHLLFAGFLGLLLGALAVASVRAATSPGAHQAGLQSQGVAVPVTVPGGLRESPSAPILDPFPVSPPPERAAVEVPAAELVVREKATPRPVVAVNGGGWHVSVASWYGPGFYGHRTACGQTLTEGLVGVAHKTLPCGTPVTFRAGGAVVTAPVVDRGPYVAGREWDLTAGLCAALRACSTGPIEWRL